MPLGTGLFDTVLMPLVTCLFSTVLRFALSNINLADINCEKKINKEQKIKGAKDDRLSYTYYTKYR